MRAFARRGQRSALRGGRPDYQLAICCIRHTATALRRAAGRAQPGATPAGRSDAATQRQTAAKGTTTAGPAASRRPNH